MPEPEVIDLVSDGEEAEAGEEPRTPELPSLAELLQLPSSPPGAAPEESDDSAGLWRRWSDASSDDIINAEPLPPPPLPRAAAGHRLLGAPQPEFSDAAATVILSSSDEDDAPETRHCARSNTTNTGGAGVGLRRAASADAPSSSALALSSDARPAEPAQLAQSATPSSVGGEPEPWAAQSQAVTRRERTQAATRRERAQQTDEERRFARGVSQANRRITDAADVLPDVGVEVDPGAVQLAGPEAELLERLREAGAAARVADGAVPGAVRWTMARRRRWDPRLRLFVPLDPPRTERLATAMVVLDPQRLAELVAAGRLAPRLEIWRAALAASRLCVVVPGLKQRLRRAAGADASEFARQVRAQIRGGPSARPRAAATATAAAAAAAADPDQVQEAVLRIQVTCPWVSWFTECAGDARAVGRLLWQTTADLALAELSGGPGPADEPDGAEDPAEPSGAERPVAADVAAALRVASVRSGADLADSWLRALAQIPKVTPPVAQSIAARYPTPHSLLAAWRRLPAAADREQMLAALPVAARRLGPALSARICRVFTEPDPMRPLAEL